MMAWSIEEDEYERRKKRNVLHPPMNGNYMLITRP